MGFSVFLTEQTQWRKTRMGTPSWVSPEICKGAAYSKEVDVWSFGCFAWELAAGNPPFHHYSKDIQALFDAIIK